MAYSRKSSQSPPFGPRANPAYPATSRGPDLSMRLNASSRMPIPIVFVIGMPLLAIGLTNWITGTGAGYAVFYLAGPFLAKGIIAHGVQDKLSAKKNPDNNVETTIKFDVMGLALAGILYIITGFLSSLTPAFDSYAFLICAALQLVIPIRCFIEESTNLCHALVAHAIIFAILIPLSVFTTNIVEAIGQMPDPEYLGLTLLFVIITIVLAGLTGWPARLFLAKHGISR